MLIKNQLSKISFPMISHFCVDADDFVGQIICMCRYFSNRLITHDYLSLFAIFIYPFDLPFFSACILMFSSKLFTLTV